VQTATITPTRFLPPDAPRSAGALAREALREGARLEFAGYPDRALGLYHEARALADTPAMASEALRRLGDAHRGAGRWVPALDAYRASRGAAECAGLGDLAVEALAGEGIVAVLREDLAAAAATFAQCARLATGPRARGLAAANLGMCAARRGDHAGAEAHLTEALAHFRACGVRRGELGALINLAAATIERGAAEEALPTLAAATAIARELNDFEYLLLTAQNEAGALVGLGRLEEAECRLGEALGHFNGPQHRRRRAECLVILAAIYRARGTEDHRDVAARCTAQAVVLAASVGADDVVARARGEAAV
jgi:tetratricopeptide (TPR) repeat protein